MQWFLTFCYNFFDDFWPKLHKIYKKITQIAFYIPNSNFFKNLKKSVFKNSLIFKLSFKIQKINLKLQNFLDLISELPFLKSIAEKLGKLPRVKKRYVNAIDLKSQPILRNCQTKLIKSLTDRLWYNILQFAIMTGYVKNDVIDVIMI